MTLKIIFWDVQHGSATYIKTPNGKHIVQDLGDGSYDKSDVKFSPLLHLKKNYGVNQVDQVIITHPHKDHIDDIANFDEVSPRVLSRPHVDENEIRKNIKEEDEIIFDTYFSIDKRYSAPLDQRNNPLLPENNGGVEIKTFFPVLDNNNINNLSLVTVVSYVNLKVLIPGDNEPPSWNNLLNREDFKKAIKDVDVLLAPHHGRKSGYCAEIFNYFRPKLTIISDGRFCDTSATNLYSNVTKGYTVFHRNNGIREERKCVTTRNDGVICVKIKHSSHSDEPLLYVSIN